MFYLRYLDLSVVRSLYVEVSLGFDKFQKIAAFNHTSAGGVDSARNFQDSFQASQLFQIQY